MERIKGNKLTSTSNLLWQLPLMLDSCNVKGDAMKGTLPSARSHLTATAVNHTIIFFGGQNEFQENVLFNELFIYSAGKNFVLKSGGFVSHN